MIGKYFAQARFYDNANGRMPGKDPVKRELNSYRYCDDDPVDYVDPTGEVLNIIGGVVLGGVFGGAAGLVSSAISQKVSGGKVNWKVSYEMSLDAEGYAEKYGINLRGSGRRQIHSILVVV